MRIGRQHSAAGKTQVVVLTADAAFEEQVRATFGASLQIALTVVSGTIGAVGEDLLLDQATVAVIDLDASMPGEMEALERLMARIGAWPPVIVVTQGFDATVARTLLQMRVADFMVKPVSPVELVRTCARVAKTATASTEGTESEIYTFLPAAGGVGVTTLAVQTAMLLLNSGPRGKTSTCLGRSRLSAWRLRRLSRPRAAPQSRRDRAASGAPRPAIAGGDAVASSVRPRGDRRAQPPGRDAFVRSRTW